MAGHGGPCLRRAGAFASVVVLVAAIVPGPAAARPSPTHTPGGSHGRPVCQVRDERLNEISGMVATDTGFVVVNDSADEEPRRRIFFLDADCAVVRTVRYPSRPRDTEDLAVDADGTLWVADIGDNDRTRQTVALWKLPPDSDRPVLHRMTYPDGPHDAEALLIAGDGRPIVVTKQGGPAGLYAPTGDLKPGATVPMERVGQVSLPHTTTSNPFSFLGRAVVTGAATSPDRRRVVLRTYADAFEFDVVDGDVVAALTRGTPRIVPLPDEPQGESITYSRDGRFLFTVSETADQPPGTKPTILRYPVPVVIPTRAPAATGTPSAAAAGRSPDQRGRMSLFGAVGVVGLGLLVAGLIGMARSRRSRRQ